MDELERRLSNVLQKVSERADPAAERLRHPASSPRRSRFGRLRTGWVAATSALAVVGVAVGVAAGVPALNRNDAPVVHSEPSPSVGVLRGTSDGTHPLWQLRVSDEPSRPFDQLPEGGPVDLPVPYAVDPQLVPELAEEPTLVTSAGTIRFDAGTTKAVRLLAQRDQGSFIMLLGPGHDGQDGLFDVRVEVVAPDNSRRQIYQVKRVLSLAVSPGGTLMAATTPDRGAELVDVATGRVVHRVAGTFTQVVFASDEAVLLSGAPESTTSLAWRAPWTTAGEPVAVRSGTAMAVDGGLVAFDAATGCLRRLDGRAAVIGANCHEWRSAGAVSPDGRRLSVEWADGTGVNRHGFLDVRDNVVRPWPAAGLNPSWLAGDDVLLTAQGELDGVVTARCDLTTGVCARPPAGFGQGIWRGASWIGG